MIELSEDYVLGLQTENRRLKAEVQLVDDHLEKFRSRLVKALGRGDDLATPVDAVLAVCARLAEFEKENYRLRGLSELLDVKRMCVAELEGGKILNQNAIKHLKAQVKELKQQIQTPMLAKAMNERDEARDRVAELEAGTIGQLLLRALRERDEAKACVAELKDKLREPWRRVNIFPGDQPAPESLSCMYVHCWFEEAESWAAKRITALEDGDRWVDPRLPDQRGEGE